MKQGVLVAGSILLAIVVVVAVTVSLALFAWPELVTRSETVGPSPAMRECMRTCMTWQLTASLYKRGVCPACESLPTCKHQKRSPSPACLAALRACYAHERCTATARVACDARCADFLESLSASQVGGRW